MLVSDVQESESAVCIHPHPLPLGPPPHQSRLNPQPSVITGHRAGTAMCYGRFPLAIYFIHGSVCVSVGEIRQTLYDDKYKGHRRYGSLKRLI